MMKIIWGKKAKISYFDEIDRIDSLHTSREVEKFINLVDEIIYSLKTGSLKGKISKKSNLKSFVISKQTTLFFEINEENSRVELLLFWRNRQNPKRLIQILKEFQPKKKL